MLAFGEVGTEEANTLIKRINEFLIPEVKNKSDLVAYLDQLKVLKEDVKALRNLAKDQK